MIIRLLVLTVALGAANSNREVALQNQCMTLGGVGIEEAKKELLQAVRRRAVEQLFGSLVTSLTEVENLSLKKDQIQAVSMGYIRFEGNPTFSNGQSLGELCVKAEAFATDEDRAKLQPRSLEKKACVAEGEVATIRKRAEERAISEAVTDFDGNLRQFSLAQILPLLHEVRFSDGSFVLETTTYCVKASGTLYPIEAAALMLGSGERKGPRIPSLKILGKTEWMRTNITLTKNDAVTIHASGEVATTPSGNSAGPKGQEYRCIDACSFPRGMFGQLIGKIGINGQPFPVGEKANFSSGASGELFLGVNDCCDWSDNEGAFSVSISVEGGQGSPDSSPESANTHPMSVREGNFLIELQDCTLQSDELTCNLLATAEDQDDSIRFETTSRLVEADGTEITANRIKIGNREASGTFNYQDASLVRGVPVKASIRFPGLNSAVSGKEVRLIDLYFGRFRAKFEHVPVRQ
jgi:hypothetical protein